MRVRHKEHIGFEQPRRLLKPLNLDCNRLRLEALPHHAQFVLDDVKNLI